MKLCKKCAHEVDNNASICPYCGATFTQKEKIVDTKSETEKEKPEYIDNGIVRGPFNKFISIILCIFLGWLGGHKFYERKYIMGIIYALTFGFWTVGIIFDLYRLIKSPKYYYVSVIPIIF